MKKYIVIAENSLGELEYRTNDYDEAVAMYERYANQLEFHHVALCDNTTGELFRYRDIKMECNGVLRTEWAALPF